MVQVLPPIDEVPAAHLEGRRLVDGWSVGPPIVKHPGTSGGYFSYCYEAHHPDGRTAFLKALNIHAATTERGMLAERLRQFSESYIFERDLLRECGDRRMSRVIRMLGHGHVIVEEAEPFSEVPYLLLEMAEGDIRRYQISVGEVDCAWIFRVMHHVILGVEQLHTAHAAHQDLKPSNVLTQDSGMEMKLGDFGRAYKRGVETPWSSLPLPGAVSYAPPEQLYGAFTGTWEERKAADMYLAGSLGAQLFLGHSMSSLIQSNLPMIFRAHTWHGSYHGVLPYLRHAHDEILDRLMGVVLERTGHPEVASQYVRAIGEMTDPSVDERGHPRDRAMKLNRFSVRRYVSIMELLSKRAYYEKNPRRWTGAATS